MTFGKLTVLNESNVKNKQTYYLCKCECGKFKEVRGDALRSGATISCGCVLNDVRHDFGDRVAKKITYNGIEYTLTEFCKSYSIAVSTFYRKRKKGIPIEEIVKKQD